VQVLAGAMYIPSHLAIRALAPFHSRTDQVRACLSMLSSLADPYSMPHVLASLSAEARNQTFSRLGDLAGFNPANPTGTYVLNLSQAVDYAVASRLLTCWAVEAKVGLCRATELQVRACMFLSCLRLVLSTYSSDL
jgi:hypothetical protein